MAPARVASSTIVTPEGGGKGKDASRMRRFSSQFPNRNSVSTLPASRITTRTRRLAASVSKTISPGETLSAAELERALQLNMVPELDEGFSSGGAEGAGAFMISMLRQR